MSSPITFQYKYIDINQPSRVLIQITKYSSSSQSVIDKVSLSLKLEADALELNLNCWCTSRDTLENTITFASDQKDLFKQDKFRPGFEISDLQTQTNQVKANN
ncbi:Hypothetical_protein [Hexamita inflata]|uniref:Hypothetical_protein n=1 Tax=Hexamita inflata TaxID=28002 RepID=A0ABP1H752_9EUKA